MKVLHKTNSSCSLLPAPLLKSCFRGVCLALPLLLGAGDISQSDLAAHRKTIEEMSASEREQLQNKHKAFQQLPSETQEELRDIHRSVEKEERLRRVVENYREWLGTLSPWQREEIRKQENPTARIRLIEEFKRVQEKKKSKRPQSAYSMLRPNNPLRSRMKNLPRLNDKNLETAMRVIITKAGVSPRLSKELNKLKQEPTRRYIRILKELMLHQREKSRSQWPDAETVSALTKVIPDKNFQKAISTIQTKNLTEAEKEEITQTYVQTLILKSVLQQWQENMRNNPPTKEQLSAYYKKLKPAEQQKRRGQTPEYFNRRLVFDYRRAHDPAMREMRELHGLMKGGSMYRGGDRKGGPRDGKRPRFKGKKEDRPKRSKSGF